MAVSWRICFFSKIVCWNTYFYRVLGCAFFGPSCQKKGKFWTPTQKRRKIRLITEKLIFEYFLVFLVFFLVFFMFCCFSFLFGGFKGHVRWPKGPPHLTLNPPYFFGFCFVFVFFVSFLVFFGGLKGKGHLTWPLKRAFFVYFSVSPFLFP